MRPTPKYKICRRLGSSVFEKCQTQKYMLSEQKKGRKQRRPKMLSDMGKQLIEKQRIRFTYGISDKKLSKYVSRVDVKQEQDPASQLLGMLESRLDNVVYRLGLADTRRMARQMVSHGHITVNGKKMKVPSYELKAGDEVVVREGSKNKNVFSDIMEKYQDQGVPSWLSFDPKSMTGQVLNLPDQETLEVAFDPMMVIEYYSR